MSKLLVWSSTPTRAHCAFGQIWTIPAAQCDTPQLLLQKSASVFRHCYCSSKIPDMNITEHIWTALCCVVPQEISTSLTSMNVWTAVQDSSCKLPPRYLQILIDSYHVISRKFFALVWVLYDIRQVHQFVSLARYF